MLQYKKTDIKDLLIQGSTDTYFTPNVHFSASSGKCIIEGESYLEEAFEFYDNLIEWVKDYLSVNSSIQFEFKLTYFNTSSSRGIVDLLKVLNSFKSSGKRVIVSWFYEDPDDDDILIEVEDFMEESGLEINLLVLN